MGMDLVWLAAELDQVWAEAAEDFRDFLHLADGGFDGSDYDRRLVARTAGTVSLEIDLRVRRFQAGARDRKWPDVVPNANEPARGVGACLANVNRIWAYAAGRWPDVDRLARRGFDGSPGDRALVRHLADLVLLETCCREAELAYGATEEDR
jgi:hypothetical protein